MADQKITDLAALTGASTATGDLLEVVDISDTTMAASGTNKKQTLAEHAIALKTLGGAADMSYYRLLLPASGRVTASAAAGTKYFMALGQTDISAPAAGGVPTHTQFFIPLVAADIDVSGLTTKLRITAQVIVATAPAVTITVGLYPLTAGATLSLGTVITGSTVAFVTPGANTISTGNSGDFDLPADGNYAPGFTVSGTPAAVLVAQAQVQVRNV